MASFDASVETFGGYPDRARQYASVLSAAWRLLWSVPWLAAQLVAVVWHRLEHRRIVAGELTGAQVAALIAEAWGDSPRGYAVTQSRQPLKARRTVRRAGRVFRVSRLGVE